MKRALSSMMVLGILATSTANAQHVRVSVGAGALLPNGGYWQRPDYFGHPTRPHDAGWQYLGAVEINVPRTRMGLRVDGMHGQLVVGAGFSPSIHRLTGGIASLVCHIGQPMAPRRFYLLGGAGYMNAKSDSPVFPHSESKPALGGGAGLTLGAWPFNLFVEGRLNLFVEGRFIRFLASGTPMNFIPITVGLSFGTL